LPKNKQTYFGGSHLSENSYNIRFILAEKKINKYFRIFKETDNFNMNIRMPLTGEQINISSIYLNLDKAKGVYFSKDVKNVIFTFPNNLSDIYYYDINNNDTKGVLYRVSNNTRINMKGLKKFVFQSFNNNIDGILF
jgi:hypothetical protein